MALRSEPLKLPHPRVGSGEPYHPASRTEQRRYYPEIASRVFDVAASPKARYPSGNSAREVLDITFAEHRLRDLFSSHDRIERRFGPELSRLIRCRFAVLSAARALDLVPARPPVGLTRLDGSETRYAVALGPGHRLRFEACKPSPAARAASPVTAITIIGVEATPATEEVTR